MAIVINKPDFIEYYCGHRTPYPASKTEFDICRVSDDICPLCREAEDDLLREANFSEYGRFSYTVFAGEVRARIKQLRGLDMNTRTKCRILNVMEGMNKQLWNAMWFWKRFIGLMQYDGGIRKLSYILSKKAIEIGKDTKWLNEWRKTHGFQAPGYYTQCFTNIEVPISSKWEMTLNPYCLHKAAYTRIRDELLSPIDNITYLL